MNEIDLPHSEAVINAAAQGAWVDGHERVGEVLTALHAPATPSVAAPMIVAGRQGAIGRVARRTAVAATAAVLGVAGVAAAESGVLDPVLPGSDPVVEIIDDEQQDAPADEAGAAVGETDEDSGSGADGESDDDVASKGHDPEIEGVDVSDGVDDEELVIACAAVGNHGEYVRLVARDKLTEHDGSHGDRVSEAAGSECGKPDAGEDEDEDEDDDADDGDEEDDADVDGGPGNGNGHSNGNGKGHGHGKGHAKDVTDE